MITPAILAATAMSLAIGAAALVLHPLRPPPRPDVSEAVLFDRAERQRLECERADETTRLRLYRIGIEREAGR